MIVVADSGPLHYLILLDQTDLLAILYGEAAIPQAVLAELSSPATPEAVQAWLAEAPPWLSVVTVEPNRVDMISDSLDLGEREAIALAGILSADLLLMDERAGRAEARRRGIQMTGTLGVLRAAAERDLIQVPEVVRRLRETNFYVEEGLIEAVFGQWLGTGR